MSLVKWKDQEETFPTFSSFFDDFFTRDLYNGNLRGSNLPAVNISEDKDNFEVEVAAPGLKKEDFNVNLENHLLTISAEHKEENEEKEGKKINRREFSYTSFNRSFNLPESVEANNINAKYKDGVLKLTLPKKEEAKKQPPKHIEIS
jgi:HSP20 family protein